MLTADELATIRAALRYWTDEIVPHGQSAAKNYFDSPDTTMLKRRDTDWLLERFTESEIRFVGGTPPKLMTRLEAATETDCDQFCTVIVSAGSGLPKPRPSTR